MGCDEVNGAGLRELITARVIDGREVGGFEITDGDAYLFSTETMDVER